MRYYENVVVRLKKPGEAAVDVDTAALTRGQGQRPAGTAALQRTITVSITAMDPKTSSVTVKGPNGYVYSRKVEDKKTFASIEGRRPAGHDLDRGDADLSRSSEKVEHEWHCIRLGEVAGWSSYPATQLPSYPATEQPSYPATQLPNHPACLNAMATLEDLHAGPSFQRFQRLKHETGQAIDIL